MSGRWLIARPTVDYPAETRLVALDDLRVRWGMRYRGSEQVGPSREKVRLSALEGRAQEPRGTRRTWSWEIRLSDVKRRVRELAAEDVAALDAIDERVARLTAELRAVRGEREELVDSAWRRASRVSARDLTDRIEP